MAWRWGPLGPARSALPGDLAAGIFAPYIVPPFAVIGLWIALRRVGQLEATREQRAAAAAGEAAA